MPAAFARSHAAPRRCQSASAHLCSCPAGGQMPRPPPTPTPPARSLALTPPPIALASSLGSSASRNTSTASLASRAMTASVARSSSPRLWKTCSAAPTSAWLVASIPAFRACVARDLTSLPARSSHLASRSITSIPARADASWSSTTPSRSSSEASASIFAALARSPDVAEWGTAAPPSASSPPEAPRLSLSLPVSFKVLMTRCSVSTVLVRFSSCFVFAATTSWGSTISTRTLPMDR
mmetsp:Transcript_1432/g.5839  ORF Transcript_1432/g.5839 Transcript_1432/m.5839 type:complete len:238 (+) Transcript_1432:1741-2454(+)